MMEAESRNQCDLCEEVFDDMERLIIHKDTHQRDHIFVCPGCYKAFSRLSDLKQHTMGKCSEGKSDEVNNPETYICETCGDTGDSVEGLLAAHRLDVTDDCPDQNFNSTNELIAAHSGNVAREVLPDIDMDCAEKIVVAEGLSVPDEHLPDDGLLSVAKRSLNGAEEMVSDDNTVSDDGSNGEGGEPLVPQVCSAAFSDNKTDCGRSDKSNVRVIGNSPLVYSPAYADNGGDNNVDKHTRTRRKCLAFNEGNEWNDHKKTHSVKRKRHTSRALTTNSTMLRVSTGRDNDDVDDNAFAADDDDNIEVDDDATDDGDNDDDDNDDDNEVDDDTAAIDENDDDNESDDGNDDVATDDDNDDEDEEQTLPEKSHPCYQCNSSFAEASELTMHLVAHSVDQILRCVFCDEQFKSRNQLFKHMRSHDTEESYTCRQCDKALDTISEFISHFRTHLAEKQFECKLCGTSFSRRNHVVAHMRLHSGEKPFQCTKCKKAFGYKDSLKKHADTW